ncbi:glycosyltransferase family 2 protein [Patescibacteria group bacterium]|nr:glycosyltransferase family 2 protein [Patescibacteria group bacterium]
MKILKKIQERFFEILPGFLVWLTFILAILISFIKPLWAIYFIIIFDIFWLIRVYYLTIHMLSSWINFKKALKIDWWKKVQGITDKNWQDYLHIVFLPTFKEPLELIDKTFNALAKIDYPAKQLMIVLAGEEMDRANFLQIAEEIAKKYHNVFLKILITLHPENLPDEMPGKGSNLNYAGYQAKKIIDEMRIPYEKVIVSSFDIDTQVYPQYFSYLTYKYLSHPKPTRASFQPLALYHNNIWESDPITRVVANSTTFWLLTDLARSERLFTFSSHSMSFKALVDVGFWQKDIVTEDSRIFLQCLFKYDGDYRVEPMFIPVSMNTVYMGNLWKSLANQYKQMRRWAWGVEHLPYIIKQSKKHPKMPFKKKMYYFWNQGEGMYSWATAPMLILILGRLPLLLANKSVQANIVAQNAPLVLEWLMNLALVGLILCAILSTIILPQKPKHKSWLYYPIMVLQWLIFPITMIIFGSFPATDSQTRMMLGGRFKLGFWVTEKK